MCIHVDAYSDSLPLYSPLYSYPSYSRGALSTLHIAVFPPSCRCAQHAGAGPRRGRAPRAGWRRGEGTSAAGATAPRGGVKILRVQLALERTRVQLRSAALGCLHRSRSPRIRAVLRVHGGTRTALPTRWCLPAAGARAAGVRPVRARAADLGPLLPRRERRRARLRGGGRRAPLARQRGRCRLEEEPARRAPGQARPPPRGAERAGPAGRASGAAAGPGAPQLEAQERRAK